MGIATETSGCLHCGKKTLFWVGASDQNLNLP
jgi:hypothetical protein